MGYWTPAFNDLYEEFGSRRESWSGSNSSASVVLRCSWNKRFNVIIDLLENLRPYPDRKELVCFSATVSGSKARFDNPAGDKDLEAINYNEALITVSYKPPTQGGGGSSDSGASSTTKDPITGDDVTVTDSLQPEVRYLTMPGESFLKPAVAGFTTKATKLMKGAEPAKLERRYVFTRNISGLRYVRADIINLYNTVNNSVLQSALLGKPADTPNKGDLAEPFEFQKETLLLNGLSLGHDSATKRYNINITYSWFQYDNELVATPLPGSVIKYAGHNHFYDHDSGFYTKLLRIKKDDGVTSVYNPYPAKNHANILFAVKKGS